MAKTTLINRLLGNPSDFKMVRRVGEGRKPIFSFLDSATAAAATSAEGAANRPSSPPVQRISLIAKPLDKYEQKLLAELAKNKGEEESSEGEAALRKPHQKRQIQIEDHKPEAEGRGRSKKKTKDSGGVKGTDGSRSGGPRLVEAADRWRPSPANEEAAAVGKQQSAGEEAAARVAGMEMNRGRYNSGEGGWREPSRGERSVFYSSGNLNWMNVEF